MANSSNQQAYERNDDSKPESSDERLDSSPKTVDQQFVKLENNNGNLNNKKPDPPAKTNSIPEAVNMLYHDFVKQKTSNEGLGDKRMDPPAKTGSSPEAGQLFPNEPHGYVKQESSSGGLRDKRSEPPAKTSSSPEVSRKQHNIILKQDNGDGRPQRPREMRPDPPKITVSGPEGSQQLSNEQQKGGFKKEINNNQSQAKKILNNTAEQTGMLLEETQKDVVRREPGGINKVDQYTESRIAPKITQARADQVPEEQKNDVHSKQENNDANQRDTGLNSSSTNMKSIGQGWQQKGVKQEGFRKDDKNTGNARPNSTDKTMNNIEQAANKQRGTQKQDDDKKGYKDRGTKLDPTTINYR
ncbi:hypothetical protein JRO89_XS08G0039100 [Xanthoceras sorbifolium]|uniref:Uncharacterized protein n=1 Tax=Xanthoceras sorbifolium TaxID=99658 RepID=A0ABQ8HNL3_9ROSI|nr:hypothetical protein JRO89_XS08G0039100 [Xanthoceras sorbifolium]